MSAANFTHGAWCGVCKRNGRVHSHKCKDCDHEEDGNHWNIHRDGYCIHCHPTMGLKPSPELLEACIALANALSDDPELCVRSETT